MSERRPARVAHLVQAVLGRLLVEETRDPRLRGVNVTEVRMTGDLRTAHVYVRTLATDVEVPVLRQALDRAAPFLRARVGESLHLRYVPELRFEYDTLIDSARHVDELLASTRGDHAGREPDGQEGGDEGGDEGGEA
jgi:ribosome-binding factor A